MVKYDIKLPLKVKVNRTNAAWNYNLGTCLGTGNITYVYIQLFTKMQEVILIYKSFENVANLTYIRQ